MVPIRAIKGIFTLIYSVFLTLNTLYQFGKGFDEYFCLEKRFGPMSSDVIITGLKSVNVVYEGITISSTGLFYNTTVNDCSWGELKEGVFLNHNPIMSYSSRNVREDYEFEITCYSDIDGGSLKDVYLTSPGDFKIISVSSSTGCSLTCMRRKFEKNCQISDFFRDNFYMFNLAVCSVVAGISVASFFYAARQDIFRRILRMMLDLFGIKGGSHTDFCNPVTKAPIRIKKNSCLTTIGGLDNLNEVEIHYYRDEFRTIYCDEATTEVMLIEPISRKSYILEKANFSNFCKYLSRITMNPSVCALKSTDKKFCHFYQFDEVLDLVSDGFFCQGGVAVEDLLALGGEYDNKEAILSSFGIMKKMLGRKNETPEFSEFLSKMCVHNIFYFKWGGDYEALVKSLKGKTYDNDAPEGVARTVWRKYVSDCNKIKEKHHLTQSYTAMKFKTAEAVKDSEDFYDKHLKDFSPPTIRLDSKGVFKNLESDNNNKKAVIEQKLERMLIERGNAVAGLTKLQEKAQNILDRVRTDYDYEAKVEISSLKPAFLNYSEALKVSGKIDQVYKEGTTSDIGKLHEKLLGHNNKKTPAGRMRLKDVSYYIKRVVESGGFSKKRSDEEKSSVVAKLTEDLDEVVTKKTFEDPVVLCRKHGLCDKNLIELKNRFSVLDNANVIELLKNCSDRGGKKSSVKQSNRSNSKRQESGQTMKKKKGGSKMIEMDKELVKMRGSSIIKKRQFYKIKEIKDLIALSKSKVENGISVGKRFSKAGRLSNCIPKLFYGEVYKKVLQQSSVLSIDPKNPVIININGEPVEANGTLSNMQFEELKLVNNIKEIIKQIAI